MYFLIILLLVNIWFHDLSLNRPLKPNRNKIAGTKVPGTCTRLGQNWWANLISLEVRRYLIGADWFDYPQPVKYQFWWQNLHQSNTSPANILLKPLFFLRCWKPYPNMLLESYSALSHDCNTTCDIFCITLYIIICIFMQTFNKLRLQSS